MEQSARTRVQRPKRVVKGRPGFGRPQDDRLQTFFMKKLRNVKLQVINAESEAELQCYKFRDEYPQNYANRKLNGGDDNYSKEKMLMIKQWFRDIDNEHYELLWRCFKQGASKWQFKQIHSQQDFPEYLFCDQSDLSYVLHTALYSQIQQLKGKSQFNESELLFLELLCFAARDQISFRIIKSLKEIYPQIIQNMSDIKDKIILHYENSIIREKELELMANRRQRKEENSVQNGQNNQSYDHEIPIELKKGELYWNFPKEEEENQIYLNQKTKQIDKAEKKQPKRRAPGRPKLNKTQVPQETIYYKQVEELLHKLITHIAWAYRYIYPEERKKKKLVKV